jgi:hypothetical protein
MPATSAGGGAASQYCVMRVGMVGTAELVRGGRALPRHSASSREEASSVLSGRGAVARRGRQAGHQGHGFGVEAIFVDNLPVVALLGIVGLVLEAQRRRGHGHLAFEMDSCRADIEAREMGHRQRAMHA